MCVCYSVLFKQQQVPDNDGERITTAIRQSELADLNLLLTLFWHFPKKKKK